MNDKRRIRSLRQRALIITGKADQVDLLPLQGLHPVERRAAAPGFRNDPDGVEASGVFLLKDFVIRPQRQAGIHPSDEKLVINILGNQLRKAAAVDQDALLRKACQQRRQRLRRLNAHIVDIVGDIELRHGDIELDEIDQLQPAAELKLFRQPHQRGGVTVALLRHGADPLADTQLRVVLDKAQHGHFRFA